MQECFTIYICSFDVFFSRSTSETKLLTLSIILTERVKTNTSIKWRIKEIVKAKLYDLQYRFTGKIEAHVTQIYTDQ